MTFAGSTVNSFHVCTVVNYVNMIRVHVYMCIYIMEIFQCTCVLPYCIMCSLE